MATSLNRKNRRRKKAAGLVAVGASATLLAGGLMPAQANAFGLGDLPFVAQCGPGGYEKDGFEFDPIIAPKVKLTGTADCRDAQPSILATIGDALIGVVMPGMPLKLSTFNTAIATPGLGEEGTFIPGISVLWPIPGVATIKGTGYNTAIVVLGGEATASSDYYMAGAVAIAAMGGVANADALFGGALATAISVPLITKNSATAKALPMGFAIANSAHLLKGADVSATALGGIASASSAIDGSQDAVCTAVYAQASVTDSKNGKNIESCTSVLFIFQQYQEGDGPVWYAIKNPLDVNQVSPFGDNIADLLAKVGKLVTGGALPDPIVEAMAGKFVPELKGSIVRVSFQDGMAVFATDLPQFFQGIFGQSRASGPLLGLSDLGLSKADVQSVSGYGIGGPALEQDVSPVVADRVAPPVAAERPVVDQAPAVTLAPSDPSSAGGLDLGGSDAAVEATSIELEPAL
ncbi:hypothetical protein MUG78_07645 [Gordonia alkaliphila]|uniref:hypothetical protein n=1 Tax=Gordonia alkaliphila TaxID=1053547 RepID=UPI001FF28A4B|nr:hypothetical protein [Gordonia alkaliphila]MCK0439334.1 hypothetical protein [Gordonia alkaliphila]